MVSQQNDVIEISSSESQSSQDDDPWIQNFKKYQIKREIQMKTQPSLNNRRVNYVDHKFKKIANIGFVNFEEKTIFKCLISRCNFEASNDAQFINHLIKHLNDGVIRSEASFCITCNSPFNAENLLGEFYHFKKYHSMLRFSGAKEQMACKELAVEENVYLHEARSKNKTDYVEEAAKLPLDDEVAAITEHPIEIPMTNVEILKNFIQNYPTEDQLGSMVDASEELSAMCTSDEDASAALALEVDVITINTSEIVLKADTAAVDNIEYQLEDMFEPIDAKNGQVTAKEAIQAVIEPVQEKSVDLIDILEQGIASDDNQDSPDSTIPLDFNSNILKMTIMSKDNFKTAEVKYPPSSGSDSVRSASASPTNSLKRKSDDEKPSETSKKQKKMSKKDKARRKSIIIDPPNAGESSFSASRDSENHEKAISCTTCHKSSSDVPSKIVSAPKMQPNEKTKAVTPGTAIKAAFMTKQPLPLIKPSLMLPSEKIPLKAICTQKALKVLEESENFLPSPPTKKKLEPKKNEFIDSLIRTEKSAPVFAVNEGASTSKASFNGHKVTDVSAQRDVEIARSSKLMCWATEKTLRSNTKSLEIYSKMLTKKHLVDIFKCMEQNCSFTTSDCLQFSNHLHDHDKNSNRKIFFDHCPYCPFVLKKYHKIVELTHHIFDFHQKDIFQCSQCFYRSREAETVADHFDLHHNKFETKKIYKCPGIKYNEREAQKKELERLERKRREKVHSIICAYCNMKVYPLKDFYKHLSKHSDENLDLCQLKKYSWIVEKTENLFKTNIFGKFQCLFCVYGAKSESDISHHMTTHPSELRYCCLRQPEPIFHKTSSSNSSPRVEHQKHKSHLNASPSSLNSTCIYKINIGFRFEVEDCSNFYELQGKSRQVGPRN